MKEMYLTVNRFALRETYTIGKLYVDGVYYCDTLEDKARDLNKNGKFDNGEKKVYGQTAIPYGTYEVKFAYSPKFSAKSAYKAFIHNGLMPSICNVPEFSGVLIHGGNTAADTLGCLLVGRNTIKGQLTSSLNTFKPLYEKLYKHCVIGKNKCYITYK